MDDREGVGFVDALVLSRLAFFLVALCAIGVLGRWSTSDGIGLSGLQGINNGWLVLLYLPLALFSVRRAVAGSSRAIAALAIAGVAGFAMVVLPSGLAGASIGWGRFVSGAAAIGLVGVAITCVRRRTMIGRARSDRDRSPIDSPLDDRTEADEDVETGDAVETDHDNIADEAPGEEPPERTRRLPARLATVGLVLVVVLFPVLRQVLATSEEPSWPPPPSAITADGAEAATAAFAASGPRPRDVGLDYAWSTAATVDPYVDGENFFPRILADIEGATSSVHILMFGWKSGDIGTEMADLIRDKLAEGVEVRIIVDGFGSAPFGSSRSMFDSLADAGAEIVVNDILPLDRNGIWANRRLDIIHDELGRADHRKLYVIDGVVAWTGGAGIEDHFATGEFHDVMVRVTGDVVRQSQAVFLTSFSSHDADLPADLSTYFPAPEDSGDIPMTVLQVVPGGFASAPQSVRELIDGATGRLDVMNPYFTDHDIVERIVRAGERGVDVRIVVSERSNNAMATAAFRHQHDELTDAGVEIWEFPAVVHAKIVVADDHVHFGTLNFDAWALNRDFEFAMTGTDAALANRFVTEIFEPDIARSQPGRANSGIGSLTGWVADKIAWFL